MGRKKIIADEDLIKLTNAYMVEKCKSNPRYFKYTGLAEYICAMGHPSVTARLLQRNQFVRGCIREWQAGMEDTSKRVIVAYKTLDVEAFIHRNSSLNALKKSLSELDNYYKSVCEAAIEVMSENRKLQRKVSDLTSSTKQHRETSIGKDAENVELKREINRLNKENQSLREVVEVYVYPEIANEILKKKGLLKKTPEIVSMEAMENAMITSSTDISVPFERHKAGTKKKAVKSGSAVITGLFDKFSEGE